MKTFLHSLKINTALSAVLSVIIGIALVVRPGEITLVACRLIAVLLVLSGLSSVFSYMMVKQKAWRLQISLVVGIIQILLGLSMLSKPGFFVSLLPLLLALIVFVHGVMDLSYAVSLARLHAGGYIKTALIGIISIAFAVIVILKPFGVASFITMLIGIALIYDGLSDLWVVNRLGKATRVFNNLVAEHFENVFADPDGDGVVYTEDADVIDADANDMTQDDHTID